MMAQKHLHELLKEDQEPFRLKSYIDDRRSQLKRASPKTYLQVKKRKPISETPSFPGNFCKNACFFSLHDSPDIRKSPLFDFSSPAKSPCRSSNAIFLHIPARTAAILLEAAMRIQKQSSASKSKPQAKNHRGFGIVGSILKRITHRSRKREIEGDGANVSVKDTLTWGSSVGPRASNKSTRMQKKMVALEDKTASEISVCETSYSCSCNGRPSSAIWSESNEDKSLDMDSSTCSQSVDSEVIEFLSKRREDTDFACCDKHFCESPFRFVLQRTPSSCSRTPEFISPAASPSRHKKEENETSGVGSLKKLEEEEEEKEQCSPVSVLDAPFEDEDDDDGHGDEDEDHSFDHECSYAIVQRAKHQLLQKLRRFEKLAELDPVELEKMMFEHEQDDDYDNNGDDPEEEQECEDDLKTSTGEENIDDFVREVLRKSHFHNLLRIPEDTKRLVSDLIFEERREQQNTSDDSEEVVDKVCNRLESWKEVQPNTIDMMVEQDFRKEFDGWKRNQEQVGEISSKIELAIFGLLVQELSDELVSLGGN